MVNIVVIVAVKVVVIVDKFQAKIKFSLPDSFLIV